MKIAISGQHIQLGSSMNAHVNDRINDTIKKHFEHAIGINVHFSKEGRQYSCSIILNYGAGKNTLIKSNEHSDDIFTSFDLAFGKLLKRIRKYKSKLSNYDHTRITDDHIQAVKYVIQPKNLEGEDDEEGISPDGHPTIVAETPLKIEKLTINDAIMMMDLRNLPALMFENSATKRINVVYYRKDGNISWVDSKV